jgi:hypothetical protein
MRPPAFVPAVGCGRLDLAGDFGGIIFIPPVRITCGQKPVAKATGAPDVRGMAEPCKTTSPANSPASKAASSRGPKRDAVFNTITSEDWRRSIASARRQPNAVSAQIRTAISSSSPKTK